jgi:hypothetical protein
MPVNASMGHPATSHVPVDSAVWSPADASELHLLSRTGRAFGEGGGRRRHSRGGTGTTPNHESRWEAIVNDEFADNPA